MCPISIKQAWLTDEPAIQPRTATRAAKLTHLLEMTKQEFRERFSGSPVRRAKLRGLMRNVAAALSNSDDPTAKVTLVGALDHAEQLVRQQTKQSLNMIRNRRTDEVWATS